MQAAEKAQNVLVDQLCRAILPGAQYSWELLRAARLVILDDSICTKADTERKDVSPDAWHQRSAGEKDEAVRASFEACSALAAAKARIPQPVRAHEALRETFYVGGGFEQLSVTLLTIVASGGLEDILPDLVKECFDPWFSSAPIGQLLLAVSSHLASAEIQRLPTSRGGHERFTVVAPSAVVAAQVLGARLAEAPVNADADRRESPGPGSGGKIGSSPASARAPSALGTLGEADDELSRLVRWIFGAAIDGTRAAGAEDARTLPLRSRAAAALASLPELTAATGVPELEAARLVPRAAASALLLGAGEGHEAGSLVGEDSSVGRETGDKARGDRHGRGEIRSVGDPAGLLPRLVRRGHARLVAQALVELVECAERGRAEGGRADSTAPRGGGAGGTASTRAGVGGPSVSPGPSQRLRATMVALSLRDSEAWLRLVRAALELTAAGGAVVGARGGAIGGWDEAPKRATPGRGDPAWAAREARSMRVLSVSGGLPRPPARTARLLVNELTLNAPLPGAAAGALARALGSLPGDALALAARRAVLLWGDPAAVRGGATPRVQRARTYFIVRALRALAAGEGQGRGGQGHGDATGSGGEARGGSVAAGRSRDGAASVLASSAQDMLLPAVLAGVSAHLESPDADVRARGLRVGTALAKATDPNTPGPFEGQLNDESDAEYWEEDVPAGAVATSRGVDGGAGTRGGASGGSRVGSRGPGDAMGERRPLRGSRRRRGQAAGEAPHEEGTATATTTAADSDFSVRLPRAAARPAAPARSWLGPDTLVAHNAGASGGPPEGFPAPPRSASSVSSSRGSLSFSTSTGDSSDGEGPSSSDDEDADAARKLQLRDLPRELAKLEEDWRPALRALWASEALLLAAPDEAPLYAAQVTRALLRMRVPSWAGREAPRGAPRDATRVRAAAAVAAVLADPPRAGVAALDEVFSASSDVQVRVDALATLASAAAELRTPGSVLPGRLTRGGVIALGALEDGANALEARRAPGRGAIGELAPGGAAEAHVWGDRDGLEARRGPGSRSSGGPAGDASSRAGRTTWRAERSLARTAAREAREHADAFSGGRPGAGLGGGAAGGAPLWPPLRRGEALRTWMASLLGRVGTPIHGLDLLGRDTFVLSRVLCTLAAFCEAAEGCEEASGLAAACLELARTKPVHASHEPVVRRAAVLAVAAALAAAPRARLAEALLEEEAAGGDADSPGAGRGALRIGERPLEIDLVPTRRGALEELLAPAASGELPSAMHPVAGAREGPLDDPAPLTTESLLAAGIRWASGWLDGPLQRDPDASTANSARAAAKLRDGLLGDAIRGARDARVKGLAEGGQLLLPRSAIGAGGADADETPMHVIIPTRGARFA